jgi:hypothetical protein
VSRSNYSEDYDGNDIHLYRGAVQSALCGRRGQTFLRDLLAALQALPDKRLIVGHMAADGCVCAIGALGRARSVDMSEIDRLIDCEDDEVVGVKVAKLFNIAPALAREVMFENDEGVYAIETDQQRYYRMVRWVEQHLASPQSR